MPSSAVMVLLCVLGFSIASTATEKCATGALMGRSEYKLLFTSEDKLNHLIAAPKDQKQAPKITLVLPHQPTHEVSFAFDGFCNICTVENLSELCSKKKDCTAEAEEIDRLVLDLLVRAVNLDELKTPISDRVRLFDIPRGCRMRTRGNSKPFKCKPNWVELEKLTAY